MAGEIKINYGVMDQIIGDIGMLAEQTESYAKAPDALSTSRGMTADSLQGVAADVATFASALAQVMRFTADQLTEAKETMMATDEGLTVQFDGGAAGAAGDGKPNDVRLGNLVEASSGGDN